MVRLLTWSGLALTGSALGAVIGLILDVIVQAISHQYIFPEGEFLGTGSRYGLVLGMWLGLSCTLGRQPMPILRRVIAAIGVVLICAVIGGMVAGSLGMLFGRMSPTSAELRSIVPLGRLWACWGLVYGTLSGAMLGTAVAMIFCYTSRRPAIIIPDQDTIG